MCAQRLVDVNPDATVRWGLEASQNVPQELRLLALDVIGHWSLVDQALAMMICSFVEDEHHVVAAMIAAIVNTGARTAAFNAAAQRVLDEKQWVVFHKLMSKLNDKRDSRNRYAHFIVGYSPHVPDAMILINPRGLSSVYGEFRKSRYIGPNRSADRDFAFVYTKHRIEQDIATARTLHRQVSDLARAIDRERPRPQLLRQLSSELGLDQTHDPGDV